MSAPTAEGEKVIDLADIVSAIAATPDPAGVTAQLVTAVAARAESAAAQGQTLAAVKTACDRVLKLVRDALLDSVDSVPGAYEGFVVFSRSGSRTLDYDKFKSRYPDAYRDLVRTGKDVLSVKYTG